MARLLNANFARIFKGKLFWFCSAAAVALAIIEIVTHIKNPAIDPEYRLIPENYLFNMSGFFLLILTAVLTGAFVGAEHSGVLRNKIVVGHDRAKIYFADLLTGFVGVFILHILFVGTELFTGFLCNGVFVLTINEILAYELLQLVSLLGMCALFTAISILIPQKLAGTIAALLLIFGFFFISNGIPGQLHEIEARIVDGCATQTDFVKKEVLIAMQNTLPLGQHYQIGNSVSRLMMNKEYEQSGITDNIEINYPIEIVLSSACICVLSSAVGMLVFRKRDIK